MSTEALLVFTTFPDAGKAREVGRALVAEKLAACVNVLIAPVASIYTWQGKLEENDETLALIKTTHAAYPKLADRLRALHPYEVPEIIAIEIAAGLPAYLQWLAAGCTPSV